jgi:hypothetical protein
MPRRGFRDSSLRAESDSSTAMSRTRRPFVLAAAQKTEDDYSRIAIPITASATTRQPVFERLGLGDETLPPGAVRRAGT